MRVCERQDLGALTVLIVSLAFYGGAVFHDRQSLPELALPWGNQEPGMMAADITGSRGADGIYFVPKGMDIANILNIIGVEGKIDAPGFAMSDRIAIAISATGAALTICDMPAITRLALGLPIDLNRASVEDLSQVPGIGKKMAIEIVQRRTVGKFAALSDLTSVTGIKEKKLIGLKKHLTIGSTP
jgi:competence protein ComEA